MLNDQNLNVVKTETEISCETDTESVYFHSLAIIINFTYFCCFLLPKTVMILFFSLKSYYSIAFQM